MKMNRASAWLCCCSTLSIACLVAIIPPEARADAEIDDQSFTFRRVAPPAVGAKKLIGVQIEMLPQASEAGVDEVLGQMLDELAPLEPLDGGAYERKRSAFWKDIPEVGRPEDLGKRASFSRGALQRIGLRFGNEIAKETRGKRVPPALVLAVILVESNGRSDAVSKAGAGGLMQLMPATAARFQVQDRFDPVQNIRGGVAYLEWLLEEFDGDAVSALAGYNAGENAVKRHGGIPPFEETRAYVPKVFAAWRIAEDLCTAQPSTLMPICPPSGPHAQIGPDISATIHHQDQALVVAEGGHVSAR